MASRSIFSVIGQSAASGKPTTMAMTAVKAKVRWIFMAQSYSIRPLRLQLIAIVAGCAAACSGATASPRTVAGRDIALVADAPVVVSARVSSGATMASLLRGEGVAASEV